MFLLRKKARKRDTVVGLDLGGHQWKGVVIRRAAQGLQLSQYAVVPAPPNPGKASSQAQAAAAAQALLSQLNTSERQANVAMSTSNAVLAKIEMPRLSPEELRVAVSLNSIRYLRRDLSSYYLDAAELGDSAASSKTRRTPTMPVLVAGAPREEVLWCRSALTAARIKAETIELSAVAAINALQRSHAQVCEQNDVLLLDIGHQVTSLNFLRSGLPLMARLIPFGGAQITDQIVQTLGVPPAVAEQQKPSMNTETGEMMREPLQLLAREVRSSIDFVERQHDCAIRHAFAGGGTACNAAFLEILSQEIGLLIQRWNPLEGCDTAGVEEAALRSVAPCLGAAAGAAVAQL
ncbi:MAG: hypothetical protein FJ395_02995 [Verrucomicrobia bacterium]|nr:hypothetical protein [Verrucomicrobiota bacterium]